MNTKLIQHNIPTGWQEKKLGDVCDIVNGSTPKRTVSEYWENGSIPWFTVDDIRSNGRIINKTNQSITDKALKETSVKLLPEDSVLLCCTASLGEVALTKIPLTTNQQFNGLISKDKNHFFPYYLFYSAQKLGESLKSKSGKTTINFLSVGSLSKEKILIPPIKEQQKIAEILSKVDEDIAKTQEVIKVAEKLKRGLMKQLFSQGINDENKLNQVRLGDLVNYVKGYAFKTTEFEDNGESRIIKVSDLGENKIKDIGTTFLKGDSAKYKDWILQTNDLILTTVGSRPPLYTSMVGRAILVPEKFSGSLLNQNNVLLRAKSTIANTNYIYYVLKRDEYTKHVEKIIRGNANQANITLTDLFKYIVPLPKNIKEQKEIAEILSNIDEKILVNKKLKEKLTKLKKGLMSDLLSGKVRV